MWIGIRQEDNDTNRAVPAEVKQLVIVESLWSLLLCNTPIVRFTGGLIIYLKVQGGQKISSMKKEGSVRYWWSHNFGFKTITRSGDHLVKKCLYLLLNNCGSKCAKASFSIQNYYIFLSCWTIWLLFICLCLKAMIQSITVFDYLYACI